MRDAALVESHGSEAGQFSRAAIADYFVSGFGEYDYTVSRVNAYVRAILEMSEQGWPGGLRWLFDEDRM